MRMLYLPKNTAIKANYYAKLLSQLKEYIKVERQGKLSKGVLILHDNASVHTARTVKQAMSKNCFKTM